MFKATKRTASGLTLVELMITLAVLAILITIGYPMYVAQVAKSKRADARSAILEIALAEEREFAAWGGYSEPIGVVGMGNDDALPAPDANSVFNADLNQIVQEYGRYYNFDVAATDTTFTIQAIPVVADDDCARFIVDQTGTMSALNGSSADSTNLCWK